MESTVNLQQNDYMAQSNQIRVSRVVRFTFGGASLATLVVALIVTDDPRWYGLSGACGIVWWAWDLLVEQVFDPAGDWLARALTGQLDSSAAGTRPTLEDTIRLLEHHLEHGASPKVEINCAIRLAEIYTTAKHNPERARQVMEMVRQRYPDAEELKER
ncbi:MAG: hypothetical protein ACE5HT_02530 [Gemmatimonadales bacterium]